MCGGTPVPGGCPLPEGEGAVTLGRRGDQPVQTASRPVRRPVPPPVSRATAYRYFPTQEYLLSEAALNGTREEMDGILEAADASATPEVRIDAVVRGLQERTLGQEASFRALLRASLEQPFEGSDGEGTAQRRGGRRLDWIERALAPVWPQLDEQTQRRLAGALSLCLGIESLVVLEDICGYSPEEAVRICRWAAQAILRAGLSDTTPSSDGSYSPAPESPGASSV